MTLSPQKIIGLVLLAMTTTGFIIPETHRIPVSGATSADWNIKSFWHYPWGRSGTHKGIDIFAKEGTPVLAATNGLIVSTGEDSMGGNYVFMLGAKWRFHYYAHLQQIDTQALRWVSVGDAIGKVGSTGNAKGKPPHLHYDIRTLYPQPWLYEPDIPQAWNRLFFVDPNQFLHRGFFR